MTENAVDMFSDTYRYNSVDVAFYIVAWANEHRVSIEFITADWETSADEPLEPSLNNVDNESIEKQEKSGISKTPSSVNSSLIG